jgi:hypothetical protein
VKSCENRCGPTWKKPACAGACGKSIWSDLKRAFGAGSWSS